MKKLFSILVGILACCIVVRAQSYVRAGDGDDGKILYNWDRTFLRWTE